MGLRPSAWERSRQEWLATRAEAETRPCPDCARPAESTCVGIDGRPLTRSPAHPGRITAAARARTAHLEEHPTP